MAKRGATSDINHDNWNDPYEPDEAGTFKSASQNDLHKRVIKTAKRRISTPGSITPEGNNKNVFASLAGFKTAPPTASSGKLFGFLGTNSSNKGCDEPTNGTNHSQTSTQSTTQQQYLSSLQQLNRSVSDWIKTHVDSNPFCILTPVFNDYDKHLKEIQKERDDKEKSTPSEKFTQLSSAPSSIPSFDFGRSSSSMSANKFTINVPTPLDSSKNTGRSMDMKVTTNSLNSDKPFHSEVGASGKSPLQQENIASKSSIFSSFKSDSTSSNLFTKPDPASLMVNPFLSGVKKEEPQEKPFSFSNGSTPTSSTNNKVKDEEEESEEPPKVEFVPVKEEGSVFSTRCKVFVKKDKNYTERGIGTLFIKKVGEDKHQLLVRAETVLGNVLVNVLLSSSVPLQRMGRNNVMLVCLPTPQDVPPPTTVLLRVKTAEEADDLLATLQKYTN